jgi:uncharacterized protein
LIIQQWDLSCGAAALATVLAYQHGKNIPERSIAEAMLKQTDPALVRKNGGFSLLDLKRFAESQGYVGAGYADLTSESLVELAPIIIPITVRSYRHFVVFRGFRDGRAIIADPAFGNLSLSEAQFAQAWNEPIGFTVELADGPAPPGNLAVENAILPVVNRAAIWNALK